MLKSVMVRLMAVAILAVVASPVAANDPCGCGTVYESCTGCGVEYVEKIVMVPTWETESRVIHVTEYRMEPQERTRVCYRRVPIQVEHERTFNVCIPEVQTRMVRYTECVPVTRQVEKTWTERIAVPRQVERKVTVMVPHRELRTGHRMVCETYYETVVKHVTCDRGHWDTEMVEVPCSTGCSDGCGACGGVTSRCLPRFGLFRRRCCEPCVSCVVAPCGGCGGCAPTTTTVARRVWVPNVVTEEVPTKVIRTRMVPQEYSYHVTVCRPQTRTQICTVMDYETHQRSAMVNVTTWEPQTKEKEVQYTTYRTEPRTETYTCTEWKTEPYEITETVNVCVPVPVERTVNVPVCRYVPKTVTVAVQTGCGTPCGSSCGSVACGPERCRRIGGGLLSRLLGRNCGCSVCCY